MRKTIENKINYFVNIYGEEIKEELMFQAAEFGDDTPCKTVCEFLTKYVNEKGMKRKKKEYTAEEKAEYTADKKQKLNKALGLLDEGVKEVFSSGKFADYLRFASRFHNYSFRNQILIMMQNPEAEYVAGFQAWKSMGRHVKKGEHGILILAPNPVKFTKTIENEDGEEEEEEIRVMKYKTVSVFGDNQTDGKEIPKIVHMLDGNIENFEEIKGKLIGFSKYPVFFDEISQANGYFSHSDGRIVINKGMSETQTIKTMVHEIAHSIMHKEGGEAEEADRQTKEVQAEGVAYVVLNYIGIDTSDYSFGYVAGWAVDKEVKQLKASLDIISKTAEAIIDGITTEKKKEVA